MRFKIIQSALLVLVIFLLSAISIVLVLRFDKKTNKEYEESHVYVNTIVSDKYFTQGYCWAYGCIPTQYTIVSVEYLENGKTITWTNNVSQDIYNSYSLGDKLVICSTHSSLLENERN